MKNFFKNTISKKRVENKFRMIRKILQSIQRYSFPQNNIYGRWSSERQPDVVGVNDTKLFEAALTRAHEV